LRTSLKLSNLPPGMALGNFGFAFQRLIERRQMETLATCAFIREYCTVLVQGPPDVATRGSVAWVSTTLAAFRPAARVRATRRTSGKDGQLWTTEDYGKRAVTTVHPCYSLHILACPCKQPVGR
jgi:hypothetical protein